MTLLSGKQQRDPANVVHQGDLLIWTLQHLCWGVLPSPLCPARCCCDGGASPFTFCCTLERHLLCVLLVVILGKELRGFSLLQLPEWLKGRSSVVCGVLSSICLWAGRS